MFSKYLTIFSLIFITSNVSAQTIWCKTMKLGCTTPEERAKAHERCERMGNDSYREALIQASSNPTIWQYAGMNNAYEYAAMRKRGMVSICIKNSPELRN